jgi:hypothetical protein
MLTLVSSTWPLYIFDGNANNSVVLLKGIAMSCFTEASALMQRGDPLI